MAVHTFRNPHSPVRVGFPLQDRRARPAVDAKDPSISEASRREEAWRLRSHVALILCLSLALALFGVLAG